jgi:hypothetical protein
MWNTLSFSEGGFFGSVIVFLSLSEIVANPPREVEQQMVPLPVWQKRRLARLYDLVTTSLLPHLVRARSFSSERGLERPVPLGFIFQPNWKQPTKLSLVYNRPGNETAQERSIPSLKRLESKPHLMTRGTHPFWPRRRVRNRMPVSLRGGGGELGNLKP